MITLTHSAIFAGQRLRDQMLALIRENGKLPTITGVEIVRAEDDPLAAMLFAYLADDDQNGGLPLAVGFKLAEPMGDDDLRSLAEAFVPRVSSEMLSEAIMHRVAVH